MREIEKGRGRGEAGRKGGGYTQYKTNHQQPKDSSPLCCLGGGGGGGGKSQFSFLLLLCFLLWRLGQTNHISPFSPPLSTPKNVLFLLLLSDLIIKYGTLYPSFLPSLRIQNESFLLPTYPPTHPPSSYYIPPP